MSQAEINRINALEAEVLKLQADIETLAKVKADALVSALTERVGAVEERLSAFGAKVKKKL